MTPDEQLWQLELENESLRGVDYCWKEAGAIRKNDKLCQNFPANVGRSDHYGRASCLTELSLYEQNA